MTREPIPFHFPPDLFSLLADAIPLLCRGKNDVLIFFQGCGVNAEILQPHREQLRTAPATFRKHAATSAILTSINAEGDEYLRPRRELIKRVVEFDDFTIPWPGDQLKAKGLVASIREAVNKKDAFTRMEQEREAERSQRLATRRKEAEAARERHQGREKLRHELTQLFAMTDAHRRGKALEAFFNLVCEFEGILVREAFTISDEHSPGVLEQIDGALALDGEVYLVEMKWLNEPMGVASVQRHISRLYQRGDARGIVLSASGFTDPSIETCRLALTTKTVILFDLRELIVVLERGVSLADYLRQKVQAAILTRQPFTQPLFETTT